jgi:hypothetical protein
MCGWTISGLIFALWVHHESRLAAVYWPGFVHFVTSHVLCGLFAATLSFFAVTALCIHTLYPVLFSAHEEGRATLEDLARLDRRVSLHFLLAVASPLLAVSFVALGMWFAFDKPELKWLQPKLLVTLLVIGPVGLIGLLASYWFSRAIRGDEQTLASAATPEAATLVSDGTVPDSLWSSTLM